MEHLILKQKKNHTNSNERSSSRSSSNSSIRYKNKQKKPHHTENISLENPNIVSILRVVFYTHFKFNF